MSSGINGAVCPERNPGDPFQKMPPEPAGLPERRHYPEPPDESRCHELWDKYQMLPNIRRHSLLVAHIADRLATAAEDKGIRVDTSAVKAAGLLHDLAKTWCLSHKGSHAMLGAAWVVKETGHYEIAQGVLLHVSWPWQLPYGESIWQLPILVQYADKRVRHDQCVTLEERFADLVNRYGKSEKALCAIAASHKQAVAIEQALSNQLGYDLNEDTFDCGRVVL